MTGRGFRVLEAVRSLLVVSCLALALLSVGSPAAAQAAGGSDAEVDIQEEPDLLRRAAALESRGDHAGAEEILRRVLERNPNQITAVVTLARVLRNQGRGAEILPVIRTYLEDSPGGPTIRSLQLAALAREDDRDGLRDAAREWIEQDPGSMEVYREVVGRYGELLGTERALDLIDDARERIGRRDVLAMEAGDLLERSGDAPGAVREWSFAVLNEGNSIATIIRNVGGLPGARAEHMERFVGHLRELDLPAERLRAVARIALDAGYGATAVELASDALPGLRDLTRKGFLAQFGARAEDLDLGPAALWAYENLQSETESRSEARALDYRIADMALALGDTARSLGAWQRIAESLPLGAPERHEAIATSLDLELSRLDPQDAVTRYGRFRGEFPDVPELDGLAARVARVLIDAGEEDLAVSVLRGVRGAESAKERAYLNLARGNVESGADELSTSVSNLRPAEATRVLDLVSFLRGAGERGAALGGRMASLAHRDRPDAALRELDEGLSGVSLDDRPGLLALGARVADEAGRSDGAAELRRRIVAEFPDAPERPEAAIRLARHLGTTEEGREEAVRTLEELILSRPGSAVVPEARRELERLRTASAMPGGVR